MIQQIKQWTLLVSVVAVLLAVVPVIPVRSASAQGDDAWLCVQVNEGNVVQSALNIRSGPDVNYAVIATMSPGDQFLADMSRDQAGSGYTWVPVKLDDGSEGWTILRRLDACPDPAGLSDTTDSAPVPDVTLEPVRLEGVNDDGTLDHDEIAVVARSVVLLANVRNNRITATGTGTITSADGMIVTNAHVVEDAEMVAVGLLADINDPPEFLYLGEIIKRDEDIDVALIAIRSDIDGRSVNVDDLGLQFITPSLDASSVYRGDPVYIFGYPGIGNDFLVVTTGSIVSVENGEMFGERLPVWYRTDAEIAPGNSGGLVVNGNGEFIGIPTFVEAEEVTGGRLGGIRPAQVALMAVMNAGGSTQTNTAATPPVDFTLPVTIDARSVTVYHGAVVYGEPGITFDVMFTIAGWEQRPAEVVARVFHDDLASKPLVNKSAPAQYRDRAGAVRVSVPIEPCCERASYEDEAALQVFLPYSALGLATTGTHALKVQIALEASDGSWQSTLSWEFLTVQVE